MALIAALDQGTTSSRTILFREDGQIAAVAQKEFQQHFPKPAWVEHDPLEIWTSQLETFQRAIQEARCSPHDIKAVGITNQRETTLVWDRRSGSPVYPAIVWQDRRTSEWCDKIKAEGFGALIRSKTGLEIDAYFSASKIVWILDNVSGARSLAEQGHLAFGTVDTWLMWNLTHGKLHITDISNASRTMLFNIHTLEWDQEILERFNIPMNLLPEVRSSSEIYAEISHPSLPAIPIAGIAGDQQAALFGQTCLSPGLSKCTYGTGCFLLQNIGNKAVESKNRLLTTIAWRIREKTIYALEGSVFIGGALIQWLRDGLGIIEKSSDVSKLASSVPDSGGVYLVPAFAGLGAPYWDQYARGIIVGITRGTNKAHIARAAEEAIALQVADLLQAMQKDSGIILSELRVDGGGSKDDLLLQIQSDILGIPVVRSAVTETTALGAAYLAGLAVGVWKNTQDLATHWKADKRFEPQISKIAAGEKLAHWSQAIKRAMGWQVST